MVGAYMYLWHARVYRLVVCAFYLFWRFGGLSEWTRLGLLDWLHRKKSNHCSQHNRNSLETYLTTPRKYNTTTFSQAGPMLPIDIYRETTETSKQIKCTYHISKHPHVPQYIHLTIHQCLGSSFREASRPGGLLQGLYQYYSTPLF